MAEGPFPKRLIRREGDIVEGSSPLRDDGHLSSDEAVSTNSLRAFSFCRIREQGNGEGRRHEGFSARSPCVERLEKSGNGSRGLLMKKEAR